MTPEGSPVEGKPRRRGLLIALAGIAGALVVALALTYRDGEATRAVELGRLVRPGDAAGFNVLLVTLDTVRSDHLGCYGYEAAQTPAIDSLMKNGLRFDDAVASVPLTLPSHATMLTGLYPPRHGVRNNGTHHLTPDHVTLAETLSAHGYDTAAFLGCFVLDERFGLNQGFDVYDFQVPPGGFRAADPDYNERQADAVTDAALRWLTNRQTSQPTSPFFLWVHYFDAHMPYESPLQNAPQFAGRPYDAEIAFTDRQFQRVLDELDKLNLRERTLIVLVSDHGEALGEHGESSHGLLLYDCTLRVAFILSCPALFDRSYRVDDRIVGLVDLRATLEDLLGLPTTGPSDGVSLLAGDVDPERAIYIETQQPLYVARWSPLYGLRRRTEKFILAPEREYYNLQEDSMELLNLYASEPSGLEGLEQQLAQLQEGWTSQDDGKDSTRVMSEEEIMRLASLGYVQTDIDLPPDELPDPKVMVTVFNQFAEAGRLCRAGEKERGLALARDAAERCDTLAQGNEILAGIYLDLRQPDRAVEILRQSAERSPDVRSLTKLAQLLLHVGRSQEAEEALQAAEAIDPQDGRILLLRGEQLARQGRYADAIAQWEQAIRLDENRVGIPARTRIARIQQRMQSEPPP